jgi:hypothetical protein
VDRNPEVVSIMERLAAPFTDQQVKWKPQTVQGNRALALAYIDARAVQKRLDEVLGPENWQSKYEVLPDGAVCCTLSVRLGGEWITKSDVGGQSEQPDGGDRIKAAFSDSLKRAAVQFGIGRHLYDLPKQWVGYDPQKRQFTQPPKLPGKPAAGGNPPPAGHSRSGNAAPQDAPGASQGAKTAQNPPQAAKTPPGANGAKQTAPKADPQQAARASEQQVERIDVLLGKLRKNAKWMNEALMERFGKQQPIELTVSEADQVIAGLESKLPKSERGAVDETEAGR